MVKKIRFVKIILIPLACSCWFLREKSTFLTHLCNVLIYQPFLLLERNYFQLCFPWSRLCHMFLGFITIELFDFRICNLNFCGYKGGCRENYLRTQIIIDLLLN